MFLCVFMQIWPPAAALGVLSGIHPVFTPERVLPILPHVCHHEVLHGGGPRGDSYHFFCLKWACRPLAWCFVLSWAGWDRCWCFCRCWMGQRWTPDLFWHHYLSGRHCWKLYRRWHRLLRQRMEDADSGSHVAPGAVCPRLEVFLWFSAWSTKRRGLFLN